MPTPEVNNATKTDDLCEGCGACCAPDILGQMTDPYLEVTQDDLKDEFTSKSKLSVKSAVGGPMGLGMKGVPGRTDLVFKGRHKAIFVHGCFWHRHAGCALARLPKTRHDFWVPKLEANRRRDERNLARLQSEGWQVLVVWECELGDLDSVTHRVKQFLKEPS